MLLFLIVLLQVPLPGLLADRRLAEDLLLVTGDTVQVSTIGGGSESFLVEGIFERKADPARISRNAYEVRFHLPDLERLLGSDDRVDRFAVTLSPGAEPDSLRRWIEGIAYGVRAYPTAVLADESSTTFRVVSRFHRAIAAVTILASGIFLLCVMVIRVDERRRDVRVLRLLGISARTIFGTVVLEAMAIALLGSILGGLLGMVIAAIVNAYYANFYDTTLRFALVTPQIVLLAAGLGLILGIVAGALAALRVVRLNPERLGER